MRKVLWVLFALVVFTAAAAPLMAAETFMVGQTLQHNLSICIEKKDAIEILDAEAKGGFAAANAVWEANPKCGNADVVGPTVGKVVHTQVVTRGEKKISVHVVEILGPDGKVMGYFMTSAGVTPRRERDS